MCVVNVHVCICVCMYILVYLGSCGRILPNTAITMENNATINSVTTDRACARLCIEATDFVCRSFELVSNRCQLSVLATFFPG